MKKITTKQKLQLLEEDIVRVAKAVNAQGRLWSLVVRLCQGAAVTAETGTEAKRISEAILAEYKAIERGEKST